MTSAERPEADSLEQRRSIAVEEDERVDWAGPDGLGLGIAELSPADAADQLRPAGPDEDDYPPA